MPGTKIGGEKAAKTNLQNDPLFYRKIGQLGGKASEGGAFSRVPGLAQKAGSKGGKVSKRGPIDE